MSFKKKISIAILGSTGSIGKNTLSILEKELNNFKVDLLSCNKNRNILLNQIIKFYPKFVIINNLNTFNYFKKIKFKKKIKFFYKLDSFKKFYKKKFDKVVLGISSINGIEYAFSFLSISHEILIANKETIVCGGKFFLNCAKKLNCSIKSIDSEHYCISSILNKFHFNEVDKIYLTASGGPFLNCNFKDIKKINFNEALKHPTWKMGKKISIDSSTMANKGLEVMEASILFNIHPKNIKIKIHKESKVHSIIILKNGLIYLVAHNTTMKIPIRNTLLNYKDIKVNSNFFFKKKFFEFTFDEINLKKFKMLNLAYKALNLGPRACIFYNVINDYLVNSYLNKKIFYYEIYIKLNKIINNKKLSKYFNKKVKSFNDIQKTISYAKMHTINI